MLTCCLFGPAFGCCEQTKAGRNTQQTLLYTQNAKTCNCLFPDAHFEIFQISAGTSLSGSITITNIFSKLNFQTKV